MMINITDGLAFDDLLLVPKHSEVKTRADVNISVEMPKNFRFAHPIIPANMSSICGVDMAKFITETDGLALLHRFAPIEEQFKAAAYFNKSDKTNRNVGVSVGVKKEDYEHISVFYDRGVRIICVDIAHGDSKMCIEMCNYIAKNYPNVLLIAGNIATGDGAKRLWEAGADVVKCGIGNGGTCSTRIETGNGVPQVTALSNVADAKAGMQTGKQFAVIADGGIRHGDDCVKSLCFADMIMIGNMFSGTNEAPGETLTIDGVAYKEYNGSSTHKTSHVEGVKSIVPLKGPASNILSRLFDGIRSGASYQGVRNLKDLKKDPKFFRITNAGLIESHPHDVKIVK